MVTGTRDHWLQALEAAGVPAGPINTLDQVYQDPHVVAREMKCELPHPIVGKVPVAASPLKFFDRSGSIAASYATVGPAYRTDLA
jgi:crotonobetainyl-CoA:carnitine CoA-transferase CaiB-like acyl-CoA transferase